MLWHSLPASAAAWATNYVLSETFNPGGIGLSGFNSGINHNQTSFSVSFAYDVMRLTLCDSSYNCYAYTSSPSGYLEDNRSISYGRAKCNAADPNLQSIYVNWCYTRN